VPTGLTQGAAQVTVKLAPLSIGRTGSLKVAVIMGLLIGTAVAPLSGVTEMTVGASATSPPGPPRIGSRPPLPLPPQPATSVPSRATASQDLNPGEPSNRVVAFIFAFLMSCPRGTVAPTAVARRGRPCPATAGRGYRSCRDTPTPPGGSVRQAT